MQKMKIQQFFVAVLFSLLAKLTSAEFTCKRVTNPSSKHSWKVEQFTGNWNGIELYAFNDESKSFQDFCFRMKITEVNEMGEVVMRSNSSDLYNSPLALRYLRLTFSTNGAKVHHQVTLNMTNVGYWSNDDVTVQVLRRDESQLLVAVCKDEMFYAMLLNHENSKDDLQVGKDINKKLLDVKGLTVLKSVEIDECAEIPQNLLDDSDTSESSSTALRINIALVAIVFSLKSIMSVL